MHLYRLHTLWLLSPFLFRYRLYIFFFLFNPLLPILLSFILLSIIRFFCFPQLPVCKHGLYSCQILASVAAAGIGRQSERKRNTESRWTTNTCDRASESGRHACEWMKTTKRGITWRRREGTTWEDDCRILHDSWHGYHGWMHSCRDPSRELEHGMILEWETIDVHQQRLTNCRSILPSQPEMIEEESSEWYGEHDRDKDQEQKMKATFLRLQWIEWKNVKRTYRQLDTRMIELSSPELNEVGKISETDVDAEDKAVSEWIDSLWVLNIPEEEKEELVVVIVDAVVHPGIHILTSSHIWLAMDNDDRISWKKWDARIHTWCTHNMHCPHIEQWCDRSGLIHLHFSQYRTPVQSI